MTKTEFEAQTPEQRHAVNQNARLADIASMVAEAISLDEGRNSEGVREMLIDIHSLILPNSSYTATPEENAAFAAQEPTDREMHRLNHVKNASAERIEKYILQTFDAGYTAEDGMVLFRDLQHIRNYINYGVPLEIYDASGELEQVNEPGRTPCQTGDCHPSCNICDEGKYVSKKAQLDDESELVAECVELIASMSPDHRAGAIKYLQELIVERAAA